jgi:hypothetical protein
MQDVAERVVARGRKEAEIAVAEPFERRALAAALDLDGVEPRIAAQPADRAAGLRQHRDVALGREREARVAVVQDGGGRAIGISLRRKQAEHVARNARERHGRPARSRSPARSPGRA